MTFQNILARIAAAALAMGLAQAHAIEVTPTFIFNGSIDFENQPQENFGPEFPGGVIKRDNFDGEETTAYSTISGTGFEDPVDGVTFTNGANAFGGATATSSSVIRVVIQNTESFAQDITWNGLIFAGGLGIVQPDVFGECRDLGSLNECGSYFAPPNDGGSFFHNAAAFLNFGATLDGEELYSGQLSIDAVNGFQSSFDRIALNNLRAPNPANPGEGDNPQYRWWDETEFTIDLGTFQPGEIKVLEFFVVSTVSATGNDGCSPFVSDEFQVINCIGAQSGFGDPDNTGGINHASARSYRSLPFSAQFDAMPTEIPLPAAFWLFGSVLAGGLGARRMKKARTI